MVFFFSNPIEDSLLREPLVVRSGGHSRTYPDSLDNLLTLDTFQVLSWHLTIKANGECLALGHRAN